MAYGVNGIKAASAEFVFDYVDKRGIKWLRNNQASDEVNDKDFQVFLDRLMKHA